jgi:hypothetical protein
MSAVGIDSGRITANEITDVNGACANERTLPCRGSVHCPGVSTQFLLRVLVKDIGCNDPNLWTLAIRGNPGGQLADGGFGPNRDSCCGELALADIPFSPLRFDKLRHCFEGTFDSSHYACCPWLHPRARAPAWGAVFHEEGPHRHSISCRMKISLSCKTSALKRRGASQCEGAQRD